MPDAILGMNPVLLIVIAIAAILVIALIATYNSLVKARNRVKNQWSQIDVQLTRRAELIPNLIECVKGYAAHEKETLERVMKARSAMMNANTPKQAMEANAQLTSALPGIFALSESYPGLKADSSFLKLQTELSETESKVAYARQFYNDTVMLYKDKIQQFPTNIFAALFGFRDEGYYIADAADRASVKVKF
ncbi:MAG: LemA family protein [Oscillospiraceae bacterium]|jgi:LemA protein|nr:LemA family protein [Oscillospiraceae bacterium]